MGPSKAAGGKQRVRLRLTQVSPAHRDARLADRVRNVILDPSRPSTTLGRASRNRGLEATDDNLWIESPIITKEHARFLLGSSEKQPVILRDLHSTHGTWIGSRRIDADYSVQDGDVITFGQEITAGSLRYDPHIFMVEIEWQEISDMLTPEASSPISEASKFVVPENTDDSDLFSSDMDDSTPLRLRRARSDHSGESNKSRNSSISRNFEVPYSDEDDESFQNRSSDEDAEGSLVEVETDYSPSCDEDEQESPSLADASNVSVASSQKPESLAGKSPLESISNKPTQTSTETPVSKAFSFNHSFFKMPHFGAPAFGASNVTATSKDDDDDDLQEISKSAFDATRPKDITESPVLHQDEDTPVSLEDSDSDASDDWPTDVSPQNRPQLEPLTPSSSSKQDAPGHSDGNNSGSGSIGGLCVPCETSTSADSNIHPQDAVLSKISQNDGVQSLTESSDTYFNIDDLRARCNVFHFTGQTHPHSPHSVAAAQAQQHLAANAAGQVFESLNGRDPSPSDAAMAKSHTQEETFPQSFNRTYRSWLPWVPPPQSSASVSGKQASPSKPFEKPKQDLFENIVSSCDSPVRNKYTEGPFVARVDVSELESNPKTPSHRHMSIQDIMNDDTLSSNRKDLKRKADNAGITDSIDDAQVRATDLRVHDSVDDENEIDSCCLERDFNPLSAVQNLDEYIPMAQQDSSPPEEFEYIPMAQQASESAIFREAALHPIMPGSQDPVYNSSGENENTAKSFEQFIEALKEPRMKPVDDAAVAFEGDTAASEKVSLQNALSGQHVIQNTSPVLSSNAGVNQRHEMPAEPPRKRQKTPEKPSRARRQTRQRGLRRFMGKLVPFMAGAAATATVIFGAAGALISTMPDEIKRQARREMGR